MTLLDVPTLINLTNRSAYGNTAMYSASYMDSVIQTVSDEIAGFIGFQPYLHFENNEEGLCIYQTKGSYAGRYFIELKQKPLVPGNAYSIFNVLNLTYGLSLLPPSQVSLQFVQIFHHTSQITCLAPGVIDAFSGIGFGQYFIPSIVAVGYIASYYAGWSTGINDPVPNGGGTGLAGTLTLDPNGSGAVTGATLTDPGADYETPPILVVTPAMGDTGNGALILATLDPAGGGFVSNLSVLAGGQGYAQVPTLGVTTATSFNAKPIPTQIQEAAALLVRERIIFDDASNNDPSSPFAGFVTSKTEGSRSWSYGGANGNPNKSGGVGTLGFGTILSDTARNKLVKYQKRRTPVAI